MRLANTPRERTEDFLFPAGRDFRSASNLTVYATYKVNDHFQWYGEATGAMTESTDGTPPAPALSYFLGPAWQSPRITVRANYAYLTRSYFPLAGYWIGDRKGPFGELRVRPFRRLELHAAGNRLARAKGSAYKIEGESLADMLRAVRVVKSRAAEFGVNPERVGVMGFSAGGELAALAAVRFDTGAAESPDAVERVSSRPAFQALVYPAIPKEMKLSKDTPAAFLLCGENDRRNISQGLPELYLEMKKAGANAELHVYTGVGHGFGLRPTSKGAVAAWPARFVEFLGTRGMLK
ncbi:MAG: alpha/beta hydrolase fold domain-containing protein [Acidobacteria bacterium]|nr:alpha/beta hydrolase fold domain-containing protein [Acidobacteriota bacterium]